MMKNDCINRLEKKEDYREVESLVRESFWNVYRPGCYEHYVLHQLRNDPAFVPELDFVMYLRTQENAPSESILEEAAKAKAEAEAAKKEAEAALAEAKRLREEAEKIAEVKDENHE